MATSYTNILSTEDVNYLNQLPEVLTAGGNRLVAIYEKSIQHDPCLKLRQKNDRT
jgi:hypothetical protein